MTNCGKFKIVEQPQFPSTFIKFILDGYVNYRNGTHNVIYFVNRHPFNTYKIGDYLEIDLDKTKNHLSTTDINDVSEARKYGEIEARSNNSVSQASSETMIQVLNRAIDSDTRNKYTASMEVDPKTGNVFYHLSGQRK